MKSNGFGSMEQSIVIHVPREQAPLLKARLDCVPLKPKDDQGRSYVLWRRWSTRTGDEEDVVFELFTHLEGPGEKIDWQIDWRSSEY